MDFTNFSDLEKYLNTPSGQNTMTTSGLTIKEIVSNEANELKSIIEKYMNAYFEESRNSVSGIYNRTGGLQNSLIEVKLEDVKVVGNVATVSLNFDEDAIRAYSIFNGDYTGYNKLELMDHGWEVRDDVWFHDIPNFGEFKGLHFLKDALDEYNSKNPYGLDIKVEGLHYEI